MAGEKGLGYGVVLRHILCRDNQHKVRPWAGAIALLHVRVSARKLLEAIEHRGTLMIKADLDDRLQTCTNIGFQTIGIQNGGGVMNDAFGLQSSHRRKVVAGDV